MLQPAGRRAEPAAFQCCSHVAKPSKLAAANRRTRANKEPKLELNSSIVNVRPPFVSDDGIRSKVVPKARPGMVKMAKFASINPE